MKDKRQRIAVAWPYAAVYSDPAFAASILQAAANSVGMPYGYPPNTMLPQMPVMAQQMPTNHFPYATYRYSPYTIPQRSQQMANCYPTMIGTLPTNYSSITIPKNQTPPHDIQSPSSPQSALSLSPGSDKFCSPMKPASISSDHSAAGLLITASSPVNHQTLLKTEEKPKLFKPYKEA